LPQPGRGVSNKEKSIMRIILLAGNDSTGKTTTINDVFDQITKGMTPPPVKTHIPDSCLYDFEATILYLEKKVAFFSLGDILYRVEEAIIKYSHVDVLILAHNIGGPTKKWFADTIRKYPPHCVIDKTAANDADNARACKDIIAKI
jgi:nicotinamide riboside kinase